MALATDRDALNYFASQAESVFGDDANSCMTSSGTVYVGKLFTPDKKYVLSYATGRGSFILTINGANLIVARRDNAATMMQLSAALQLIKSNDFAALQPNEAAIHMTALVAKLKEEGVNMTPPQYVGRQIS